MTHPDNYSTSLAAFHRQYVLAVGEAMNDPYERQAVECAVIVDAAIDQVEADSKKLATLTTGGLRRV